MLTLNDIVLKLQDRRLDKVSEATGLHRNTIANVRDGKTNNPDYKVVEKLSAYLSA